MPTIFSHAVIGLAASKLMVNGAESDNRIIIASALLAALPDMDALFLGAIPYNHPLGHRGFTHSLFFAALLGAAVAYLYTRVDWAGGHSFITLAIFFALVMASHGFFDALTDGGLGVAFFAPFDNTRYFFPWRPIIVAPFSLSGLFTAHGSQLIVQELALFWTFAAGAVAWNNQSTWRMIVAIACWILGIVMWILALRASSSL